MGGFYGLKAAAAGTFAAVALLCPATAEVMLDGLDEFDSQDTEAVSQSDADAPATRWDIPGLRSYLQRQGSAALAARVSCPVLLAHARADEVVPFEHSLELAGRLTGDTTLVALAGGSHTSAQHDPAIHRLTVRWLLDHVKDAYTERT